MFLEPVAVTMCLFRMLGRPVGVVKVCVVGELESEMWGERGDRVT
jgi:hypothetical protein